MVSSRWYYCSFFFFFDPFLKKYFILYFDFTILYWFCQISTWFCGRGRGWDIITLGIETSSFELRLLKSELQYSGCNMTEVKLLPYEWRLDKERDLLIWVLLLLLSFGPYLHGRSFSSPSLSVCMCPLFWGGSLVDNICRGLVFVSIQPVFVFCQPSHSLLSPSPPAFSLSQHQGLFQWVSSSYQMAKVFGAK